MYRFWVAPRPPHPATSGHFSDRAVTSRSGPVAHGGPTIPVRLKSITVPFAAYTSDSVCARGVAAKTGGPDLGETRSSAAYFPDRAGHSGQPAPVEVAG